MSDATYFHDSDDWRTLAACADDDPNDWVWIVSHKPKDRARANKLKQICATCPVRQQCLDAELNAMRNGELSYGVFGGTDHDERRTMLGIGRRFHRPSTPMEHGTVAGYVKHTRYPNMFGPPCDECRQARGDSHNTARNTRRAEARAARDAYIRDEAARQARIRDGVTDWVQHDHPTVGGVA